MLRTETRAFLLTCYPQAARKMGKYVREMCAELIKSISELNDVQQSSSHFTDFLNLSSRNCHGEILYEEVASPLSN